MHLNLDSLRQVEGYDINLDIEMEPFDDDFPEFDLQDFEMENGHNQHQLMDQTPQNLFIPSNRLAEIAPQQGIRTNAQFPTQQQQEQQQLPRFVGVSVSQLGNSQFQSVFKFSHFNRMQSQCFDEAFKTDHNLVVSAPTGAGKTGVMELAILRHVSVVGASYAKVIYIAPTRALCGERQRDWEFRFRHMGIQCKSLTGDTPFNQVQAAQQAQIIVTTPEKWDSITRQSKDSITLVEMVGLLLIDEMHTVKDGVRGATLEAIVTRMKSLKSKNASLRILAVSATVPNVQDFADWISDTDTGHGGVVKSFGQEFRPVQLQTFVHGYPCTGNSFKFEDGLKYKLLDILKTHADAKPSLIFCSTRKSVQSTAEYLANEINRAEPYVSHRNRPLLMQASKRIGDKKLAHLVSMGVAFHHGGLDRSDRREIESLFGQSILMLICSTSTLAVGINLPAHLVIIKGTQHYDFSLAKAIDYSDLDILQMVGRAGRPQFDVTGTAVILTTFERKSHYEKMDKEVIESCLHESLMEHLNAEISMGSIKSVEQAFRWLHSTFLYVRIKKNPAYYRLKNCSNKEAALSAEKRLEAIFLKDLGELEKGQLAIRPSKESISSTEYGDITNRYSLRILTVQRFVKLKPHATQREVLEALSKSDEFQDIRFHSDKAVLNTLNNDVAIRYPVQGRVVDVHQKIFLLIQASIAGVNLDNVQGERKSHSLTGDTKLIMKNASRIIAGMVAIFIAKQEYRTILSSLKLSQAIKTELWDNSSLNLKIRQIEGVGPVMARSLSRAGIDSFAKLLSSDATRLNMLSSRNPPFGTKLIESASKFPQLTMTLLHIQPVSLAPAGKVTLNVEITVKVGLSNPTDAMTFYKGSTIIYAFVAGTSLGNLIETRRFPVSKLVQEQIFTIKTRMKNESEAIICSMICGELAGTDIEKTVFPFSNQAGGSGAIRDDSVDLLLDDDSSFWEQALLLDLEASTSSTTTKNISASAIFSAQPDQPSNLKDGYEPCKHTCGDKLTCRHLCCREGVPVANKRKRNTKSKEPKALLTKTPAPSVVPSLAKKPRQKLIVLEREDIYRKAEAAGSPFSFSSDSDLKWEDMIDQHKKSAPEKAPVLAMTAKGSLDGDGGSISFYDYSDNLPSMCVKVPGVNRSNTLDCLEDEDEIEEFPPLSPFMKDAFHNSDAGLRSTFPGSLADEVTVPSKLLPAANVDAEEAPSYESLNQTVDATPIEAAPEKKIDGEAEERPEDSTSAELQDDCSLMFNALFA